MGKVLDILAVIGATVIFIIAVASDNGFDYASSIVASAVIMTNTLVLATRRLR